MRAQDAPADVLARQERPPTLTSDTRAGALPIFLTPLVGRELAVQNVQALLDSARLVTLTGSGGCGKTRLAIEAALRQAESYADGVCWVGLASLADPALIADAVAAALGI